MALNYVFILVYAYVRLLLLLLKKVGSARLREGEYKAECSVRTPQPHNTNQE